jgi:hypothetical protein
MPGSRFFLKYFAKLLAQACQTRPAQTLDFDQYRVIHRFFLSVTVNHSHMNVTTKPRMRSTTHPRIRFATEENPPHFGVPGSL